MNALGSTASHDPHASDARLSPQPDPDAGHEISDISYATWDEFPGWDRAPALFAEQIAASGARRVLEIGGGREPTLPIDEVHRLGLDYTVNDLDAGELALADPAYTTLCCDIARPLPPEVRNLRFDFIFSRMVNEHVADARTYYQNIFALLEPGGTTAHAFAALGALPMLANRCLPETISDRILSRLFAQNPHAHHKFPARYRWGEGPTRRMQTRFAQIGYQVDEYAGYFGHGYYRRLPPLHDLEQRKARWLAHHPRPALCSYAYIRLTRSQ